MLLTDLPPHIFAKIYPEPNSGCWLWGGAQHQFGYGKLGVAGKSHDAHRWVYQRLVGPVPAGLVLDHLCRTPACCNPDHLEPVTQAVNSARGYRPKPTHCKRGHGFTSKGPCQVCIHANAARRTERERAAKIAAGKYRPYRFLTVAGVTHRLDEWSRLSGVGYAALLYRVKQQWPTDIILSLNGRSRPRKTHCVNGHAFTTENRYFHRGSQQCRICRREAGRRSFAKARTV